MVQPPDVKEKRKKILKEIILGLHHGLSIEAAKTRFEKEVGDITATEIAELEQALIDEGTSPDEIKKFCNVHALLFESSLAREMVKEQSPTHPVSLFKAENREIEKLTKHLKELAGRGDWPMVKTELAKLKGIEAHYVRKEQLLFPFLEKYGFMGPSKVMWGKHNEIRAFYKSAAADPQKNLTALLDEVEGMIFKEENILFPASLEKLKADDWVEILKQSDEVGYVFIEKPKETSQMIDELKKAILCEPAFENGVIDLPTGKLALNELMGIFNVLPIDITFVDRDDKVRYFSQGKDRIFVRTKSVIGRQVQNCHPPQSLEKVEAIISSFRSGQKNSAEFWIDLGGRLIYIRYFAVRDVSRNYLGCLEVTQDITGIKKFEGEKRL
jgi:PAS domain S-box-containing protein